MSSTAVLTNTDDVPVGTATNPLYISGATGGSSAPVTTGGVEATFATALTVTAAAYTSGNCVGGLVTLTNAARVSGGSGLIQSVVVNSKSAQTTQLDVIFFKANPSASTFTDKTAIAVNAADFDKVLGVAHITDWTSLGTPSFGQAQNLAMPYVPSSAAAIYYVVVTRSTPTYASTTDLSVDVTVIQN